MKVTISFKHLEHTPALDERIQDKTQRLQKYLGGNIDIHWTCYVQEGVHRADVHLYGPSIHYSASAGSKSMYKTFDLAVSKLEKQIRKKQTKWKNKIHHKHQDSVGTVGFIDPELAWADYDEEKYDDLNIINA